MVELKVVLEKDETGGYIAHCPALKGCHSQGDTMDEALHNIREAIEGCLETTNERAIHAREKYPHSIIRNLKVAVGV